MNILKNKKIKKYLLCQDIKERNFQIYERIRSSNLIKKYKNIS